MLTPWKKSYDQPAAAAKSLQSCPTLCDPMDSSPQGSSVHRILQARILEWVAISFSTSPIISWQIDVETMETVRGFIWGAPISLQMVTADMKLKDASWKKIYDQPRQHMKKQRHYFAHKGPSSQSYGLSSSHIFM